MKSHNTLYLKLRAENPYYRPAQALALARTAVRAAAAGFRITRLGVVWGGAVWAWRRPDAWMANDHMPAYRVAVNLANAINHRDNVTGWMKTEGWFGDYAARGLAAQAVARGYAMLARRHQPRWYGSEGVYVDIARALDAALTWSTS